MRLEISDMQKVIKKQDILPITLIISVLFFKILLIIVSPLGDTPGTALDVNMVSLDESLSVNTIQTHLGDNIEIRCDIVGKPVQPKVKWYRNNVDLATLNIPNIKVSFCRHPSRYFYEDFSSKNMEMNGRSDNVDAFLMNLHRRDRLCAV